MDTICSDHTLVNHQSFWCYVWPGPYYGGLNGDYGKKHRIANHKYWRTKKRQEDCKRRHFPLDFPLYAIVIKPRQKKFGAADTND